MTQAVRQEALDQMFKAIREVETELVKTEEMERRMAGASGVSAGVADRFPALNRGSAQAPGASGRTNA